MLITRFAPSPTGYLHLGHAFSAWQAWGRARAEGGRFLLRIEDTDLARCWPEFDAAILEDLTWLGLEWELPVMRQSQQFDRYRAALETIRGQGLAYPCFCTRSDIRREIEEAGGAPHGPPGDYGGPVYPGTCRNLDEDLREARLARRDLHAWRLDVTAAAERYGPLTWTDEKAGAIEADPTTFGDVVLTRKDTPTSYHLSVVVDDAHQDITLVVRGSDLFTATHTHRLLQAILDLPTPTYHHHPLLLDDDGRRFAKRDESLTLRALREAGHSPGDVIAMTAGYLREG